MAASRVAAGSSLQVILRGKDEVGTLVVVIPWLKPWHFWTESRLVFILHTLFSQAFNSGSLTKDGMAHISLVFGEMSSQVIGG